MPPRKTPLERTILQRTTVPKPRRSISPASDSQRLKARSEPCVVTGARADEGATVDAAHLWARGRGGCSDPLCTVPLDRSVHALFDQGKFDLLPHLLPGRVPELQHALGPGHANGDLLGLLHRLTGVRWAPETPNERNEA
jgi:hypothetical protein